MKQSELDKVLKSDSWRSEEDRTALKGGELS